MPTDVEKLVVQLSADIKQYQREMQRAQGVTNQQARAIENRFKQMNRNLDDIGRRSAQSLIAPLTGIGAALSVQEVLQYADAWTKAKNDLAVAGVVGGNQVKVLDSLYDSAQRNAAPVGALAGLFGKAAQAGDNLGATQAELIKFADGVGVALRVQGASATEASGALTQLGQLLGSARVQAEEFNSVNEGARPILIAVANGLDEAGGSVNKLKQLVNDGKVSGQQFFQAFLKGLPSIQAMAANATQTIDQGITKINNAFTRYIGETDASLGASQRLVQAMNAIADNFDQTADVVLKVASIIAGALVGRAIGGMIAKLGLAGAALLRFTAAVRAAATIGEVTTAIGGLSAAAGPIGLLIGGAVVAALALFASSSSEAAGRSKAVTEELERMGLLAKPAADAIDKTAKSLDQLTDGERVRKIRELNDEIDRLKGGGGFGFGDQGDELGSIATKANVLRGLGDGDAADKAAIDQIRAIASALSDGSMKASDALAKLKEIAETDVSKPVIDLNSELLATVERLNAAKTAALGLGDTADIDRARETLTAFRDELSATSGTVLISKDQREQMDDLIQKFEDGKSSAAETKEALRNVASVNPEAQNYVSRISQIIDILADAQTAAQAAKNSLANVVPSLSDSQVNAYRQYAQSRSQGEEMLRVGRAYADEAERQNKLSKDQLAVEKEIASIKKDLAATPGFLPDDEIRKLAEQKIAADRRRESRSGSGGKTRSVKETADSRFDQDIQSVRDRTAALIQEQQTIGAGYRVQEQRRMALDLEQSALADLREEARRKGQTDLSNIKLSDEQRQKIQDVSAAYAEQADALRRVQEAQEKADRMSEEFYDSFKSSAIDAINGTTKLGDALANVAKKLGDLLLNNAFDALFSPKTSASDGGLFGSIFSGIGSFLGFRAGGGPVQKGKPYVVGEKRPELFVPDENGTIMPRLPTAAPIMPKLVTARGGGLVTAPVSIAIDARGADSEGLARVERQLRKLESSIPGQVVKTVKAAQGKRIL